MFLLNAGAADLRMWDTNAPWLSGPGRVTSHLRPPSRRCIAITAVPGNAILVAVQINRDVAAYFGQPTEA